LVAHQGPAFDVTSSAVDNIASANEVTAEASRIFWRDPRDVPGVDSVFPDVYLA
jgi:hypothetical protein